MEVRLTRDLEAKLTRIAAHQGRSIESLIEEQVHRLVDHDEWFRRKVEAGIAAADRGELIDHEDVLKMINRRFPG